MCNSSSTHEWSVGGIPFIPGWTHRLHNNDPGFIATKPRAGQRDSALRWLCLARLQAGSGSKQDQLWPQPEVVQSQTSPSITGLSARPGVILKGQCFMSAWMLASAKLRPMCLSSLGQLVQQPQQASGHCQQEERPITADPAGQRGGRPQVCGAVQEGKLAALEQLPLWQHCTSTRGRPRLLYAGPPGPCQPACLAHLQQTLYLHY